MLSRIFIFILFQLLQCNITYAQSIFVGGGAGINTCYLGGKIISEFSNRGNGEQQLTQLLRTYRPGFYLGLTSDFYPMKTKKQIFLVSINIGYQQYSQAISWSGKADSLYPYLTYRYYESKVNRELYYSFLTGFNIRGFIFKTGVTFKQTIASSGLVSFTADNYIWLNSGNNQWPSKAYKLNFGQEELLTLPVYIAYNIKINDALYIAPEGIVNFGVVGSNYIDFGYYGITWGRMITASLGVSVYYSTLKKK